MKNIIPFKKDVIFKTNLSEITSISLENTLNLKDDKISGDFIVSGEYKISDSSKTVEPFELKLPFEIIIDERYDCKKAIIDIDDFYYEIVNNNVLSVNIDVLIDKLEEKPIVELDDLIDVTPVREIIDFDLKEEEQPESVLDKIEQKELMEEVVDNLREDIKMDGKEIVEEKINSLFSQFSSDSEVYVAYNVVIVREGDTLDNIMEKYGVSIDELEKYNNLDNLKLGDKIIIPNNYERD